jgi:hypothetical protein
MIGSSKIDDLKAWNNLFRAFLLLTQKPSENFKEMFGPKVLRRMLGSIFVRSKNA